MKEEILIRFLCYDDLGSLHTIILTGLRLRKLNRRREGLRGSSTTIGCRHHPKPACLGRLNIIVIRLNVTGRTERNHWQRVGTAKIAAVFIR